MKKKYISIKSKILFTLIICTLVVLPIVFAIINYQILTSYSSIEEITVDDRLNTVVNVVNSKIENISVMSADWAEWDATYFFVEDENQNYIDENLQDITLINLDLNMMLFINKHGEVTFSKFIDLESYESIKIDEDFFSQLDELGISSNLDQTKEFVGLIDTLHGPMMVATHPILTSAIEGPIHGNLLFGRFLDESVMSQLSKDLNLEVFLEPEVVKNVEGVADYEIIDEDTIKGSKYVKDLSGEKVALLSALLSRDVMKLGKSSITTMMALMGISFFVVALILFSVLYKIGLSRLMKLHQQVVVIEDEKDISARIKLTNQLDEIYDLGFGINKVLSTNEVLFREVEEAKNAFEKQVIERTKELSLSNSNLKKEIIKSEKIQREVTHLAYHDHLTSLPNQRLFSDRLEKAIIKANREDNLVAVVFIDLDEFKVVNDTIGHKQGDELLKKVSNRLSSRLRKDDLVSRFGGDEFVILLQNFSSQEGLRKVIEKIKRCFEEPFNLVGEDYYVSCSMGIAQYPCDGDKVDVLVKNADIAMYTAKDHGKNQYVICTDELKENVIETLMITNSLYHAIERNEMEVYYQPQVNSLNNEITGLEALLRWKNPDFGSIPPSRFIPIAEKTRLIIPIGEWVLRSVCEQMVKWEHEKLQPITVAVNFSGYQITSPKFLETVERIIEEMGVKSNYLEVEITESIAMDKTGMVNKTLEGLRKLGLKVSIDDFGTEYSSLSRLKELTIDRIKIDLTFVHGIGLNEKDEFIIKAIMSLAENLGLSAIAEGVETVEQLEFLNAFNCYDIQGYYYYKPMKHGEIEMLLREQSQSQRPILCELQMKG